MRKQYGNLGRSILVGFFTQHEKPYTDEQIAKVAPPFMPKSLEDLLAQVGRGETDRQRSLPRGFPGEQQAETPKRKVIKRSDDGWFNLRRVMGLKFRWPGACRAIGQRRRSTASRSAAFTRSCRSASPMAAPSPASASSAFSIRAWASPSTRSIRPSCTNMTSSSNAGSTSPGTSTNPRPSAFPAQIKVTALNQPGSLAEIAGIIGKANGNIDSLRMVGRQPDFTDMLIDVEVWDLKHLRDILAGLRGLTAVNAVERVMS